MTWDNPKLLMTVDTKSVQGTSGTYFGFQIKKVMAVSPCEGKRAPNTCWEPKKLSTSISQAQRSSSQDSAGQIRWY